MYFGVMSLVSHFCHNILVMFNSVAVVVCFADVCGVFLYDLQYEYLSGRPLLNNGSLKHVSKTAHTETSIAGQWLNKHCSRNNQYTGEEINVLCKNEKHVPKTTQTTVMEMKPFKVSSSPSDCGI
jgi:hypothetical protein